MRVIAFYLVKVNDLSIAFKKEFPWDVRKSDDIDMFMVMNMNVRSRYSPFILEIDSFITFTSKCIFIPGGTRI